MSFWKSSVGTDSLRKIAAAISRQYKLEVAFHHGGEASHSDIHKRKISINLDSAYKQGEDYAIGLLLHEVAHVRFSPSVKPTIDPEHEDEADDIHNWLEDRRIDGLMRDEYSGAEIFQDALMIPTLDGIQAKLEQVPPEVEDKIAAKVWVNVLGRATLAANEYAVDFVHTGSSRYDEIAGKVAEIYGGITKQSSNDEVTEAAKRIVAYLRPLFPPKVSGESQGEGGGGEQKEDKHGHVLHTMGGMGAVPSGRGIAIPEQCWIKADQRAQDTVPRLKKKLIAKLRDTEHEQWLPGQRRGKLDKKRLVRVAYQSTPRLYRKRLEKKGKKYSFAVVLDTSGSMWNGGRYGYEVYDPSQRIMAAMETAATIIRTVRGLGFKAGLTVYGHEPMTVLQPNEIYRAEVVHRRLMNLDHSYYQSGDNRTHKGIKEALQYLQRLPHEKVLVVITDGGLEGDDIEMSHSMIEAAKRKGIHTLLYFVEDGTQRILEDDSREKTMTKARDLIPATLELLKGLKV